MTQPKPGDYSPAVKVTDIAEQTYKNISPEEKAAYSKLLKSRDVEVVLVRLINHRNDSSAKVKFKDMSFILNQPKLLAISKHTVEDPQWAEKLSKYCSIHKLDISKFSHLKY